MERNGEVHAQRTQSTKRVHLVNSICVSNTLCGSVESSDIFCSLLCAPAFYSNSYEISFGFWFMALLGPRTQAHTQ